MKEGKKISLTTYILSLLAMAVLAIIVIIAITKGKEDYKSITNNTNNNMNQNTISKIKDNKNDFFVIYKGREISTKVGINTTSDMDINDANKAKYNTTYYNYEKGEYKGETKGEFGEETYEGVSIVSNVSDIAISKKYNAIPRKFRNWSQSEIEDHQEIKGYERIYIQEIDLDGDSKLEYIVTYQEDLKDGDLDDGSGIIDANSSITLYDSEFNEIAELVKLEHAFIDGVKKQDNKVFLTIEDIEYIDLDNDDKMEILIELPSVEGFRYSLLKYENGKVEGQVGYKASLEQ